MSSTVERKLAAIMFTDIAGYTATMSKDQDIALSMLDTKRKALKPLIQKHKGTLVKEMGDGTLSHFPSAIDATNCSLALQKSLKDNNDLNIRIGVHLGDTSFRDDDVFGDGVNIASRLEKMSPPGGILVSKNVYDELSSRKGYDGISLGLQSMKGVGRLVEVFGLKDEHLVVPTPLDYTDTKVEAHKDKEVPSIAIIPFENKGKKEDVFYAYGISADLISDCSSAGLIRVASKKQIDEAGDLQQDELAKKLDVRYMANGELWRMGELFQLSLELYDTKDKKVVWSDRWQEKWDNLASIKGNLSNGLLKALDTISKVERKVETTNTEAYEFYLKATHKYGKRENTEDTEIARGLLDKAIDLDDNLIVAKLLLGETYVGMSDYDKGMEIFTPALKQAEELGDKYGVGTSLNNIGIVYWNKGNYEKALEFSNKSLVIFEELGDKYGIAQILNNFGLVYCEKDDFKNALDYWSRSLTILEELDDKYAIGYLTNNIGLMYTERGDHKNALDYYNNALTIHNEIRNKSGMGDTLINIGTSYWYKGDYNNALDYYNRSLAMYEELGDKRGIGQSLNLIGTAFSEKGDYKRAIEYNNRSLVILEKLGDKFGVGYNLKTIGLTYYCKGNYKKALEYYDKSLKIRKEIGCPIHDNLLSIGLVYFARGNYEDALYYLEKSISIQKETGYKLVGLRTTTYFHLTYKKLNRTYSVKEIYTLIQKTDYLEYEVNLRLYELLEDKSYLETACTQIQEKVSEMEEELSKKFLSYPIPKAIIEEYNKVFKK